MASKHMQIIHNSLRPFEFQMFNVFIYLLYVVLSLLNILFQILYLLLQILYHELMILHVVAHSLQVPTHLPNLLRQSRHLAASLSLALPHLLDLLLFLPNHVEMTQGLLVLFSELRILYTLIIQLNHPYLLQTRFLCCDAVYLVFLYFHLILLVVHSLCSFILRLTEKALLLFELRKRFRITLMLPLQLPMLFSNSLQHKILLMLFLLNLFQLCLIHFKFPSRYFDLFVDFLSLIHVILSILF